MADVRRSRDFGREISRAIASDAPVYFVACALLATCLTIFASRAIRVGTDAVAANARLYLAAAMALAIIDCAVLLLRNRPPFPTAFLLETYRARLLRPSVLGGLPMLALIAVFMPYFSELKSMIPLLNPFTWDATFIAWDRTLFFGHDAWEVLQPLLGYPLVTAFLAVLYHVWILLIYVGTVVILFYRPMATTRRQFLLGFILIWTVIGGLLATVFASVGPCFLAPIKGDPHFAAQMTYLRTANEQVPVMTLRVQDMLLAWYHAGSGRLGSGITAMPSMHVAMAMLFWLSVRKVSPVADKLFGAFTLVIWIASVHLAYHYAVDGLVSLIVTYAIWRGAGWTMAAWDGLLGRMRQPTLRTNTVPAE